MDTSVHPSPVPVPPATPEPGPVSWLAAALLVGHGADPARGDELGGPFFPRVSEAMRAIQAGR
jgi:hypothetical protein